MKKNITFVLGFLLLLFTNHPVFSQGNVDAIKAEAQKQMQFGRFGEAIDLLNKYISAKPQLADGYNLRGLCYEKRNQLEMAVFDYRAANKTMQGKNKEIANNLARATQAWYDQLNRKIEGHKREIAINPAKAVNYLEIGKCHKHMGHWAEAEQWYDEYLKREEPSPDEVIRYTEILTMTGHIEKGEKILKKFVDKFPLDWRLWSRYGYFTMWMGKLKIAIMAFEKALAIKPYFKEALDGLEKAKGKGYDYTFFDTVHRHNQSVVPPEYPIDKYYRLLKKNGDDDESRFLLVEELWKANRIEEAYSQLKILSDKYTGQERFEKEWTKVKNYRDSVYTGKINDYKAKFDADSTNKEAMLKLIEYYQYLQNYDEAILVIEKYISAKPDEDDTELLYKYAKIVAWNRDFIKAKDIMDKLLLKDPNNLEYQLFRGELSVWLGQDLDKAKEYLENVVGKEPNRIEALIALGSLYLQQQDFNRAQELCDKAKSLNAGNEAVLKLQSNIDFQKLRAEEERLFLVLESGRKTALDGDCVGALEKYEEYIAKSEPNRIIMKEYADVLSCAGNFTKSIAVYNDLLQQEYDADLDLQRAKTYYWMGDSTSALAEFERIAPTRKDDFLVNLYLGDAYTKMHQYDQARAVYDNLSEWQLDSAQTVMIEQRQGWLPVTGLRAVLSYFPQYVLISPDATYYGDNLGFRYNNQGLRIEVGLLSFLSIGAQAYRGTLSSEWANMNINSIKYNAYIRFSKYLLTGGGYGRAYYGDFSGAKRDISDAFITFDMPKKYYGSVSFARMDAAQVLYSKSLIGLKWRADVVKFSGYVQIPSGFKLSSSYTYMKIEDGNKGANFELRLGKYFYPDLIAGYEYYSTVFGRFSNYYFSPTSKKNPYSSHSLWADWDIITEDPFLATIGGRVGFIPISNYVLKEIYGQVSYKIGERFVIRGRAGYSNSVNVQIGYGARSFSLSAYWSL